MKNLIEIKASSDKTRRFCIFDNKDDTCWFSKHGSPQFLKLTFKDDISVCRMTVYYQNGFHCKRGTIRLYLQNCLIENIPFSLEENEDEQRMFLKNCFNRMEIYFDESYDVYGRICIYNLVLD